MKTPRKGFSTNLTSSTRSSGEKPSWSFFPLGGAPKIASSSRSGASPNPSMGAPSTSRPSLFQPSTSQSRNRLGFGEMLNTRHQKTITIKSCTLEAEGPDLLKIKVDEGEDWTVKAATFRIYTNSSNMLCISYEEPNKTEPSALEIPDAQHAAPENDGSSNEETKNEEPRENHEKDPMPVSLAKKRSSQEVVDIPCKKRPSDIDNALKSGKSAFGFTKKNQSCSSHTLGGFRKCGSQDKLKTLRPVSDMALQFEKPSHESTSKASLRPSIFAGVDLSEKSSAAVFVTASQKSSHQGLDCGINWFNTAHGTASAVKKTVSKENSSSDKEVSADITASMGDKEDDAEKLKDEPNHEKVILDNSSVESANDYSSPVESGSLKECAKVEFATKMPDQYASDIVTDDTTSVAAQNAADRETQEIMHKADLQKTNDKTCTEEKFLAYETSEVEWSATFSHSLADGESRLSHTKDSLMTALSNTAACSTAASTTGASSTAASSTAASSTAASSTLASTIGASTTAASVTAPSTTAPSTTAASSGADNSADAGFSKTTFDEEAPGSQILSEDDDSDSEYLTPAKQEDSELYHSAISNQSGSQLEEGSQHLTPCDELPSENYISEGISKKSIQSRSTAVSAEALDTLNSLTMTAPESAKPEEIEVNPGRVPRTVRMRSYVDKGDSVWEMVLKFQ